jgi:AmmeMemoRadiSam system protein B
MTREASVEGRFYPYGRESIFRQISEIEQKARYPDHEGKYHQTIGAVVPHAGHVYSGYQTVPFFRLLRKRDEWPETFVILHPNHTGTGPDIALDPHESWKNSVGTVPLDHVLGAELACPTDAGAHRNEHSAEVIIPYLQYYFGDHDFRILPVCMKRQTSEKAEALAARLFRAQQLHQRNIVVIASSDFSHFVSPEKGARYDQMVLDQVDNRATSAVEDTVVTNNISVCGYGPIMALMAYSGMISDAYQTTILARGHSGEVYPSREVVDYISILFYIA